MTVFFSFFFLLLRLLTFGSAVEVTGVLKKSPHQKQPIELEADQIHVVGESNPVVRTIVSATITHTFYLLTNFLCGHYNGSII